MVEINSILIYDVIINDIICIDYFGNKRHIVLYILTLKKYSIGLVAFQIHTLRKIKNNNRIEKHGKMANIMSYRFVKNPSNKNTYERMDLIIASYYCYYYYEWYSPNMFEF